MKRETVRINGHTVEIDTHGIFSHSFYRASVTIDNDLRIQVFSSASENADANWAKDKWRHVFCSLDVLDIVSGKTAKPKQSV